MVLALVFLLLIGFALVVTGLRGRRMDDHPICRRCGYDLVGAEDGASRCPECGRAIQSSHDLRWGRRKRRPRIITAGLALLLISAAGIGGMIWAEITNFNWIQLRSTNSLIADIRSQSQQQLADHVHAFGFAHREWAELERRLVVSQLSSQEKRKLNDLAFDLYERQSQQRPWSENQGSWFSTGAPHQNWLTTAQAFGGLDAERLKETINRLLEPELKIQTRSRVERNKVMPHSIEAHPKRIGGYEEAEYIVEISSSRLVDSAGRAHHLATDEMFTIHPRGRRSRPLPVRSNAPVIDLPPGEYEHIIEARIGVTFTTIGRMSFGMPQGDHVGQWPPTLIEWNIVRRNPVTILPEGESSVRITRPTATHAQEALASMIETWLHIESAVLWQGERNGERYFYPAIKVWCSRTFPIDLAFDVQWEHSGQVFEVGHVIVPKGRTAGDFHPSQFNERPDIPSDLDSISVLLIPNPEVAEHSIELHEIWGMTESFANVKLSQRKDCTCK